MSTPLRVAAFVAGLVLVFVAALGAGRLVGPLGVAVTERHSGTDVDGADHGH